MTFSSASSQMPGAPGSFSGCSSGLAQEKWPDGLVEDGTSAQESGLSKAIRMSHEEEHDHAKEAAGVSATSRTCIRGAVRARMRSPRSSIT